MRKSVDEGCSALWRLEAGEPLGERQARVLVQRRDDQALPVGRHAERLGEGVRGEASHRAPCGRAVAAGREVLDEDTRAALGVGADEGDAPAVRRPPRPSVEDLVARARRPASPRSGTARGRRSRCRRRGSAADRRARPSTNSTWRPSGEISGTRAAPATRCLSSVPSGRMRHTPEPLGVAAGVDDVAAVSRGGGVLRVDAVARDLARPAAVRARDPDLEVAGAVRAPQHVLPVRREAGVPVLGGVVGELAQRAGTRLEHPEVHVAAAVRGEDDAAGVGRDTPAGGRGCCRR